MSESARISSTNGGEPAAGEPGAEPQPRGDAPIGGQAVLEGVMMRGISTWAVAVRAPTPEQIEGGRELQPEEAALGEIEIHSEPLVSWTRRHRALRLPIIRGVVALVESMKLGFRALAISANAQLSDDQGEIGGKTWAGTVAASLIFGIGLFFLLPAGLTSLFGDALPNSLVFVVIEKVIRIGIFLAYILLISRMRDLQRVFEYHGAEHKTISCYEAGLPLSPENAQGFSRLHPRCGTSFLLIVMIVAIVVFAPVTYLLPEWYWLFSTRVIGIPLVAGLSFEVLKLFGRKRDKAWARALMWPGLQLQRLTTREPDLDQLAVSIAALEAVLAVEDPAEASEEDKVGMEVVA
ncbi:MAG: FIG069887: hypothetical protein [uncultured Solirubrobacterales bacterium]|uniref:DUF1385 domain-containing protein n=1 Tax=uncultured Solirubrobacterales bacterium TaxID=768556 RepID=A0A6J4S3P7_9ACTN|nr:MAG: FIG069887: hypothetical protein [uncultured Solirubrobacterales bacterium]